MFKCVCVRACMRQSESGRNARGKKIWKAKRKFMWTGKSQFYEVGNVETVTSISVNMVGAANTMACDAIIWLVSFVPRIYVYGLYNARGNFYEHIPTNWEFVTLLHALLLHVCRIGSPPIHPTLTHFLLNVGLLISLQFVYAWSTN